MDTERWGPSNVPIFFLFFFFFYPFPAMHTFPGIFPSIIPIISTIFRLSPYPGVGFGVKKNL